ncbi:MAG TPA: hypothetical protein VN223_12985, partial [Candidatus Elarobacter sp.]|nr:hypothetical protein [Candidatus Elarobacter sp.]
MEIQLRTSREGAGPVLTEGGAGTSRQSLVVNNSSMPFAHGRSGLVKATPGRIGTSVVSM